MTQMEKQLLQALQELPPDKRREALDFVQFLKSKSRQQKQSSKPRASNGDLQIALLTSNPSLAFLRDEPDLYE